MITLIEETKKGNSYLLELQFEGSAEVAKLPTTNKPFNAQNFATAKDYGIPAAKSIAVDVTNGDVYLFDGTNTWTKQS